VFLVSQGFYYNVCKGPILIARYKIRLIARLQLFITIELLVIMYMVEWKQLAVQPTRAGGDLNFFGT
jgi:hypothetical protein